MYFYRLLRKYACQKQSLGIFKIKLQFSFCSELTVWQGCRRDTEWQLALLQEHSAHFVPSFLTDPYWFRNNAFKLPSITLLPNQLCVWTLISVSLCIKRKCMSYKQSKYILLRWEKTNPLVKLLCCNQRLITAWVCAHAWARAHVSSFSPGFLSDFRQTCPPLAGSSHRHSDSGINFPRFLRTGGAKRWF